jgi:hypothetical protein
MKWVGIDATMQALRSDIAAFEKQAIAEVKKAAHLLMANLFENTPVWSGETVRNYVWGVNGPAGGSTRGAVGSGAPGATNAMIMGSEPRRPANENAAMAELNSKLALTKLADLYVTNLIDRAKWDLIDNGSAPSPGKARNPGGVSILAEQSTRNALEHWK